MGHSKKDTTTMLLLRGWKQHACRGACWGSETVRAHVPLLTVHRRAVASREDDKIRSLDRDQLKSVSWVVDKEVTIRKYINDRIGADKVIFSYQGIRKGDECLTNEISD